MLARSRKATTLAARVALLGFLAALVVLSFTHTDDGCVVERHCLACVWALSPADGIGAIASPVPGPCVPGEVLADRDPAPLPPAARVLASRGPPSA